MPGTKIGRSEQSRRKHDRTSTKRHFLSCELSDEMPVRSVKIGLLVEVVKLADHDLLNTRPSLCLQALHKANNN